MLSCSETVVQLLLLRNSHHSSDCAYPAQPTRHGLAPFSPASSQLDSRHMGFSSSSIASARTVEDSSSQGDQALDIICVASQLHSASRAACIHPSKHARSTAFLIPIATAMHALSRFVRSGTNIKSCKMYPTNLKFSMRYAHSIAGPQDI